MLINIWSTAIDLHESGQTAGKGIPWPAVRTPLPACPAPAAPSEPGPNAVRGRTPKLYRRCEETIERRELDMFDEKIAFGLYDDGC
ncbi:MAG: hypothetical protein M0P22_04220 [Methanoculleus sp.]|nr:hypothetical protein [Methanoculleus sp.]